jgi:prepilin-type N-terminal cleavage/methylation domain-containing protein
MASPSGVRRGMTLIELLVVVAIMLTLIITVAPNLVNTAESRRSREAARMVSSFVAKAQSRAVGRREWSGFTLMASAANSLGALDLVLADVPAVYRGDTVPALLTITGLVSPTTWQATGTESQLTLSGTNGADIRRSDLIRFDGRGPWYEISTSSTSFIQFRIRGDLAGQAAANAEMETNGMNRHNTPWPMVSGSVSFEVLRQPVPAGSPLTLGESRAVDLRWSGVGPPALPVGALTFSGSSYRPFAINSTDTIATAGASTAVLFDGTGRLRQVIVRSGNNVRRIAITGPLYLLVGRADRVIRDPNDPADPNQPGNINAADDSTGANWQYPDSFWVAIDPATGVVKTAECVPNADGTTDLERCVNSQALIRQSLLGDGR